MIVPPEYQTKIETIDSIATLPTIATEILKIMRGNNTSMREIAMLIEKDISVTAKILKVANSPLWGYASKVDSVQRALVLLGLKQVSNIVIAVSLYSTFASLRPNPYFDREQFWLHSVSTGQIARKLTRALDLNFQGEEFVAGLIHDIGKMALDQFWPDQFQEVTRFSQSNNIPMIEAERQLLNCTHAEIGAALLEYWNFPETIVTVLQYHHFPHLAPTQKELTAIVYFSNLLCGLWECGFDSEYGSRCLEEEPAWSVLQEAAPQIKQLDLDRFTFELDTELEKAVGISRLMSVTQG